MIIYEVSDELLQSILNNPLFIAYCVFAGLVIIGITVSIFITVKKKWDRWK